MAVVIRRPALRLTLQGKDAGKQMFSKELEAAIKTKEEVAAKRQKARRSLQNLSLANTVSGGTSTSGAARLLAAAKLSQRTLIAPAEAGGGDGVQPIVANGASASGVAAPAAPAGGASIQGDAANGAPPAAGKGLASLRAKLLANQEETK